jgi:hypothetical protein
VLSDVQAGTTFCTCMVSWSPPGRKWSQLERKYV